MRVREGLDLTYCTNIHAGETWDDVRSSVEEYALPLRASLSPDQPFGLGLRLSALAAAELVQGGALQEFKSFLAEHSLYVAVINGFPYGSFHGDVVKAHVFAPDWQDPARLAYTLNLAKALSVLLPDSMDGGISTIPLSYKPWVGTQVSAWPSLCEHLATFAAELVHLRESTGRLLHLDIEPEPSGLVETTEELVAFFQGPLMDYGAPLLASRLAVSLARARELLLEHIQVCFDVCHVAIQFEDPIASLKQLKSAGIRIGRVQVSSAVCVSLEPDTDEEGLQSMLAPLDDHIYLHQVVERSSSGSLRRFTDLGDAVAERREGTAAEWRIHFHVPLFLEQLGSMRSTQSESARVLRFVAVNAVTTHLEIETYTWSVLPEELRLALPASIERELEWAFEQMPRTERCRRP